MMLYVASSLASFIRASSISHGDEQVTHRWGTDIKANVVVAHLMEEKKSAEPATKEFPRKQEMQIVRQ